MEHDQRIQNVRILILKNLSLQVCSRVFYTVCSFSVSNNFNWTMYSIILNIAFKVTFIIKSSFRIIAALHSFEKISVLTCLPILGTIHKYSAQLCNFSVKFILQWSQGIKVVYIIFPFLVHSERPRTSAESPTNYTRTIIRIKDRKGSLIGVQVLIYVCTITT